MTIHNNVEHMSAGQLLYELMTLTSHITRAKDDGRHPGTVARLTAKRKVVLGEIKKRMLNHTPKEN